MRLLVLNLLLNLGYHYVVFRSKSVSSVRDFLDVICSHRANWRMAPDEELWFRGETNADYKAPLRPRLYRSDKTTDELLDLEEGLWREFKRCGVQFTAQEAPADDFEWYFLMQHYGGPTRLLDWSDGALIALHFAVRDKGYSHNEPDAAVYVLDAYWLDDKLEDLSLSEKDRATLGEVFNVDELDESILFLPREGEQRKTVPLPEQPMVLDFDHFAKRVAAQRSRFLVLGEDRDWVRSRTDDKDSRLRSIRIDGSRVAQIQEELRTCGVTESVIFPDLDGLGREISALWQRLIKQS
jgi:hypothetical protein